MIDPPGYDSQCDQSPDAFLIGIAREARVHPAVRHPWLRTFVRSDAEPEVVRDRLRAFALAHFGFVAWFPAMIETVSRRCSSRRDRDALNHAVEIEQGQHLPESKRSQFRRFCVALGLTADDLQNVPTHAAHWRSSIQQRLGLATSAFGVGVLGPGYMDVSSPIHSHVIAACDRFTALTDRDTAFFRDTIPDGTDPQQRAIQTVVHRNAETCEGREEIRRGMLFGLDARAAVWDALTTR